MHTRSHSRSVLRAAAALAVLAGVCAPSQAQPRSSTAPMPFYRRTAGWLVVDTTAAKVFLCRDLDGNGDFNGPGEVSVFLDASNASGVAGAVTSMLSLYQAADGTVYVGSNASGAKGVYAVRDNNLNGNAQDAGEASLFCNQYGGLALSAPFAISGDANYIYACLSGSGTVLPASQDGIARFQDADHDGNANGAGESSLYCDMNTIFGGTVANPFDMCAIGSTLFVADSHGTATGRIYKAADADSSGSIAAAELILYHTVGAFGSPTSLIRTCVTDGQYVYTHDGTASVNPQLVARLNDVDGSGAIDAANEVTTIWSENNLPAGEAISTSQSVALAPGRLAICSNGGPNEIILARDVNGNGLFNDGADVTTIAIKNPNTTAFPAFPGTARYIIAYGWPCPADFNMTGGVSVQDIFDFLGAWFSNDPRADVNGSGMVTVQDIFDFLAAWFGGC